MLLFELVANLAICAIVIISSSSSERVLDTNNSRPASSTTTIRRTASSNPLNGKHLRTIWTLWKKENVTGVFGPKAMVYVLDYVAKRLNFTYTMLENVTETTVERPRGAGRRGLVDYLHDGSCDLLAHDITNNPDRYAMMDLTLPWIYGDTAFLIPVPDSSANVVAVLQPFQWPVWVSLIASVVIVILTLLGFDRLIVKLMPSNGVHDTSANAHQLDTDNGTGPSYTRDTWLYVFGVLMSQGGPCVWWSHSIRLVAAAWCLAAFVLVNGYCSTLITYVISHYNPPLIESVHDLVRDPTINLLVEKGKAFELTFTDPTIQNPIFAKLREKLAVDDKKTRCYGMDDCVNSVKVASSRKVFAQAKPYLFDAVIRDILLTGKCNVEIAKRTFYSFPVSMGLKKYSPWTTTIGRAIVETFDYGLHPYWQSLVRRVPSAARECWAQSERTIRTSKTTSSNEPDKLTLTNLTGAFIVLACGFAASLFAFIGELVVSRVSSLSRRAKTIGKS